MTSWMYADRIGAYETWISKARELIAGLEPSVDGEDQGHLAQLAELRENALPQTDADRETDQHAHPRSRELELLRTKIDSLARTQEVRERKLTPAPYELDPATLPAGATDPNGPGRG